MPEQTEAVKGVPPLLGLVMARRGVAEREVQAIIDPNFERDIHDPYEFREMEKTVARIEKAISEKEKIVVHGDYDSDGISASALLFLTLKELGANVDVFLPDREKTGYGLRPNTAKYLAEQGAKMIITCDCGIADAEAIALAAKAGVDVIVTDHHSIPDQLPESAYAVIHPLIEGETYPFKGLSGGGVAFKLAQALIRNNKGRFSAPEAFEKWLVDYVALSSIADMVPIVGETRTLTHFGLQIMQKSQRPGLRQLAKLSGEPFTERNIGFYVAPRINAAGRMAHPKVAFDAIVESDPIKAYGYVQELQALNQSRYKAMDEMMVEIDEQLEKTGAADGSIVFVKGEWLPSLAGLAASKLVGRFHKPAVVMASGAQGLVGSGRSTEGVNLVAQLREMEEYFDRLGGHPAACGFTVKPGAVEALEEDLKTAKIQKELRKLEVDALFPVTAVTMESVHDVKKLGPFGQGNPKPIFVSQVKPTGISLVGSDQSHMKLTMESGGRRAKAIAFGFGKYADQIKLQRPAEIAYEVDINTWQGRQEVQIQLLDIRQ